MAKPRRRTVEVVESGAAADRLAAAEAFLDDIPADGEVVIVGASRDAADELARRVAQRRRAAVGLHRFTLTQLAARLAAPATSAGGLAPCTLLGAHAVAARAAFDALAAGRIPYFAPVARTPGFTLTLAATLAELRGAGIAAAALAASATPADQLAAILAGYEAQLAAAGLADRAALFAAATAAVGASPADPLIGLPLLLLDVPLDSRCERDVRRPLGRGRAADAGHRSGRRAVAVVRRRLAPPASHRRAGEQSRPPADLPLRRGRTAGRRTRRLAAAVLRARRGPRGGRDRAPHPRRGARRHPLRPHGGLPAHSRDLRRAARGRLPPRRHPGLVRARHAAARTPPAAPSSRCSPAPPRSSRRSASPSTCRSARCRAPTAPAAPWTPPRDDAFPPAVAPAAAGRRPPTTTCAGERRARRSPWRWESLLVDAAVIGGASAGRGGSPGSTRARAAPRPSCRARSPTRRGLAGLERARAHLAELRALRPAADRAAGRAAAREPRGASGWRRSTRSPSAPCARRPACRDRARRARADGDRRPGRPRRGARRAGRAPVDARATSRPPTATAACSSPPSTTRAAAAPRWCSCPASPSASSRSARARIRCCSTPRARALSPDLPTQEDRLGRERLLPAPRRRRRRAADRHSPIRASTSSRAARASSRSTASTSPAPRAARMPDVEAFEREAGRAGDARLAWPAPTIPPATPSTRPSTISRRIAGVLHTPGRRARQGRACSTCSSSIPHLGRSLRTRYARWENRAWSALDGLTAPGRRRASRVLATQRLAAAALLAVRAPALRRLPVPLLPRRHPAPRAAPGARRRSSSSIR